MKDKVKKALKRFASGLMAAIFAVCFVGLPRVKAVAVVDDVAVGAMSCEAFLASIGLPLTATGGSSAVTAGVTAAAGEYAAATGAAASGEAFLGTVAAGTAISTAGAILLTATAAVAVGAFAYWLYNSKIAGSSGDVYLYGKTYNYASLPDGSKFYFSDYLGNNTFSPNGSFITPGGSVTFTNGVTLSMSDHYSDNRERYIKWQTSLTTSQGSILANSGDISNNKLYLALSDSGYIYSGNILDADAQEYFGVPANHCSMTQFKSSSFGVSSYEESLSISNSDYQPIPEEELVPTKQMVIDVGAAPGTTLDDLVQTVPDAIANGQFAPTYVIQVAPSVDPPPVPVLPPEVNPNPDVEAPEDIAPFTVKLGEVFPFCIPFDVYHMVTMFAAEPEAPAATWEFTLPWSGQECEVSWSLEEWDEVAKLCRSLELVLFCVGLAVVTSKVIKW